MSILSYIPLARLFMPNKETSQSLEVPNSVRRAMERANTPKPFHINRDENGTRPWHSYSSKKAASKK
jgi:hypothetical protein